MKRFLTIVAGIILGAIILGAGAITLLWVFCDNSVSINVHNSSGVPLQKVAVIVPDSAFSGYPSDVEPGGVSAFGIADTLKPRMKKIPIRVAFDGGGHHYDVPTQLRLAPFGSYLVTICIDEHMQVSIKAELL